MKLVGRTRELAALEETITSASGRRAALSVVEGPTGIGKSSLIRQAISSAGPRFTVATATCVPLEQDFAFGAVRQLLEPVLASLSPVTRNRLRGGPAALAFRVLDGITESHTAAEAPELMHAALHGLHHLIVKLADDGPLLLVIDDLQWADAPSLRWLAYLTHRWADLPVALIAGLRTGEEPVDPEAVDTLLAHAVRLPLAGLDRDATARLLGEVRPDLVDACLEVTGGNPYLLGELVAGLRDGRLQTASDLAAYAPSRIAETVLHRLRRTSPEAVALTCAVAVLDDRADLSVAALVAEVDLESATGALEVLEAQRVLRSEGVRLSFVHSIVRNSVAEDISPARRLLLHARAARELHRQRQPHEQVAAHIIAAGLTGEPWLAEVLGAAADTAAHRGSPHAAVRYLAHAVRLPLDSCDEHARFLGRLGALELYTAPEEGDRHLGEALELAEGAQLRAEIAAALSRRLIDVSLSYLQARALLKPELEKLRETNAELALTLELQVLGHVMYNRLADGVAERLRELRTEIGTGVNWRLDALLAAFAARQSDDVDNQAAREMLATLPLEVGYEDQDVIWALLMPVTQPGPALAAAIARARWRGWLNLNAVGEWKQGTEAVKSGDLAAAREHLSRALDMFHNLGHPPNAGLGVLLYTLVEMGELAKAGALLERRGYADTSAEEHPRLGMDLFQGRAALLAARGEHERALSDLRMLGPRMAELPENDAYRLVIMARVAHAAGKREQALDYAEQALALANDHAGIPRVPVLSIRGEITGNRDLLDEAVINAKDDRLELVRALVARGSLDPARGVADLTHAFDLATEIGAKPLADRARHELAKVGLRPRRPSSGTDALTPQERAVADLAADGLTNRQISDDLFLARRTVEQHLTAAYRKLRIAGRSELKAALRA